MMILGGEALNGSLLQCLWAFFGAPTLQSTSVQLVLWRGLNRQDFITAKPGLKKK
jgi:hypothetical protein